MTVACLNLRARFGGEYRIAFDPSYDPRGIPKRLLDPQMMTIPCRFGTIFPHGGDLLAVECDYHGKTARALAALPGVTLHQDGDRERTFLFHVDAFPAVASIVKPKRRRRLSADHKQALLSASKPFRPASNDGSSELADALPACAET